MMENIDATQSYEAANEATQNRVREIQSRFDACILHDLEDLKKRLERKLEHFIFDEEQSKYSLRRELDEVAETLAQLRKFEFIESLFDYTENPDFFWNGGLPEVLTVEERWKYNTFDFSGFNLNQYVTKPNFYDNHLPYFSQIVQFIVISRYSNILKEKLAFYQKENSMGKKKVISSGEKLVIKKTFESNFNEQQLEILTDCINEAAMFTLRITHETTAQLFNCNLDTPLQTNNNRLLAYFLMVLRDNSFITSRWQSVCEFSQLFLSSHNGKFLKRTDLSSATNECKTCHPIKSEIIDKYIEKLKKKH
jgi:hypothetical protein